MNLNLGKFKKKSEDEHSATLVHPEGHQIKIAKRMLSKDNLHELSKLPVQKFEDGGDVSENEQPNVSEGPSLNQNEPVSAKVSPSSGGASGSWEDTPNVQANAAPMPNAQNEDPYGAQQSADLYQKGVAEQRSGLQNQAGAESKEGALQSKSLDEAVDRQNQMIQMYQQHFNDLDQERQNFQKDVTNQHIDPNRYINNMGIGGKIATGLGIILAGFSPIAGQKNAALEIIHNNINADIEAQKAELGKKENLLSANMRQFGNLRDATDMTKIMQTDLVKNQLAAAAAKSQSPLAQARAQQAIGQLDAQTAPMMGQLAMRRTLSQEGQNATQNPQSQMDPANKIRLMGMSNMISPQQQSAALKELNTGQQLNNARDYAFDTFDKLEKINTVANRVEHAGFEPASVKALRDNAATGLAREEAGRVNEYEFKAAQNTFPAPGDTAKTIADKKRNLSNIITQKMSAETLKGLGIDPFASGKYDRFGNLRSQYQLQPPVLKGPTK